jgi:hypothetical protein
MTAGVHTNTVAFGHLTKGWGPFEVNRQPGTYPFPGLPQPIACPCIKAYDPFDKHIHGGVDLPEAKRLAAGVVDQTFFDANHFVTGTFSFLVEGALMAAVWGNNFDPEYGGQQQQQQQQQVAGGHRKDRGDKPED